MKPALGELKRLNLREAWKNEALEFTPWLAQEHSLNNLADALGLTELELVQTEYQVGDFKLDILCTDDSGEVIIENQLEKTDHTHLGQIITYAAGVGAKKVIWVAESFRPEHVAALDFLNQNTTGDLNFFAVEMELWQIGESPMAPSFNIVAKPNNWVKSGRESARAAANTTPIKLLQEKFWTDWKAYIEANKIPLRPQKPLKQHWNNIALGKSGFHISTTVNTRENRLGVEVYIDHKESKAHFQALFAKKAAIEEMLGFAMDWQELPESHACRVAYYRPDSPFENESDWNAYFAWMAQTATKIDSVFRPLIRELP